MKRKVTPREFTAVYSGRKGCYGSGRWRNEIATLRIIGRSHLPDYARCHHVLRRAVWSPLPAAGLLLALLLEYPNQGADSLVLGIDETIERRGGPNTKARSIYRDGVRSSRSYLFKVSGRDCSQIWDQSDVADTHPRGGPASGLAGAGSGGSGVCRNPTRAPIAV